MALATDVRRYLKTIGQSNTADFTQCRVWFFRRSRIHACANTPFLGAGLQRGYVALGDLALSWLSNQLVDSGHNSVFSCKFFENQRSAWFREGRILGVTGVGVKCYSDPENPALAHLAGVQCFCKRLFYFTGTNCAPFVTRFTLLLAIRMIFQTSTSWYHTSYNHVFL